MAARPPASATSYVQETEGVRVRIAPSYAPEASDPEQSQFTWAYDVDLENRGTETVQLVARCWIITDARNRVEEVRGAGVVGEQPILKPGAGFRYRSACPLRTSSGSLRGSYTMVTQGGRRFEAEIPHVSLHLPDAVGRPH
jgi:ApaG protein